MDLFRTHVYGTAPEKDYSSTSCAMTHEVLSSEVALGGLATRREIVLRLSGPSGKSKDWVVLLYLPVGASSNDPIPCFLGLNFSGNHTVHPDPGITESVVVEKNFAGKARGAATERWQVEKIVSRGMALATVYSGDVEPDDPNTAFKDGVHKLFNGYNPEDWGTVAAVSCSQTQLTPTTSLSPLLFRLTSLCLCISGLGASVARLICLSPLYQRWMHPKLR